MNLSWHDRGVLKGRVEGKLEGKLEGKRELLREQLEAKFGPLSLADAARLERLAEPAVGELARRLVQAETLAELGFAGNAS